MGRNLAIVVGINEYERLEKLKYAKEDALKIKGFLEDRGEVESVLLFTDDSVPIDGKPTRATHTNLRDLFVSMFEGQFLLPEDNLWFFFSGHGQRYKQRDYLLPIDGNPRDIDGTGITVDFITDRLSRSGAGNIVLILDACRNVLTGARGGGELGQEATERVRERGLISIFSCQPNQQSWEEDALGQGIFTFALMKALQEGGCATAWQINSYLKNEVAALVKQYGKPPQTPYLVAQPIEKTHLILVLKNTTEVDLDRLKKTALEQEAEENFDSAIELWNRVNVASKESADYQRALERIIRKKILKKASAIPPVTRNTPRPEPPSVPNSSALIKPWSGSSYKPLEYDVFISYSSRDQVAANVVCKTLEENGVRCWIAPRDTPREMRWRRTDVIPVARVLVLIFSASTNQSPGAEREVELAVSSNVKVVPFRIENANPQGSFNYLLGGVQWLEAWTPPLDQHLGSVVEAVKKWLAR